MPTLAADPMQAFLTVMGIVLALLSFGSLYSLRRLRKLDREVDAQAAQAKLKRS